MRRVKTISLANQAYHPRTKGKVKSLLQQYGIEHTILGDGESFTGFIYKGKLPKAFMDAIAGLKYADNITID